MTSSRIGLLAQLVKPRANGRNIVGQQVPTMLDMTYCVCLHSALHVLACSWELLRKVWNRSNVYLHANGRSNSQHCWPNNGGSCCVRLHVALERCTGIAEVKVRNLACLSFFMPSFRNYMSCVFNCVRWSSLHLFHPEVQVYYVGLNRAKTVINL